MIKLSDYVMGFVANSGVKHVFLVVGGGAMHLNDSLSRRKEIEFVCNLHEQASAIAAENYSKSTNHLGVALVTTGPGGTNAVTGVAGAWLDSTPCLFISGQVKRADSMFRPDGTPLGVRQVGVQEVDIVSIVRPITKYAVTVNDPQSIRYHLERALYLAQSGRPGPVWIDIPLDVQAAPIDEENLPAFEIPAPESHHETLQAQVREIIDALNRAERPMLLAGNGIRLARAEKEFLELVELLDIPLETTWLAIDLIGDDHPLFVGRPGTIAPRGANFAIQNTDFLLAIGARLDRVITGFAPEKFAPSAWKAMVDIDPAELQKMGNTVCVKVRADAGAFMREMLSQARAISPRDRSSWKQRCADWKRRYPLVLEEHRKPEGPVSCYHLADVLSDELGPDAHYVSGSSGSGIELVLLAMRVKQGQRIYHTTALGAMGYGIAASIGVCMASGRREVVCVDGDGGFQFNIQELETVARLQLPIKFFVLNNNGYSSIRASQKAFFGEATIGCDTSTGQTLPDLRKVATAYGIQTDVIMDQTNLRAEIRRVLARPGPVVCDVHVVPDEVRMPRLSSVQLPDGSFVSKPLEDLWPFLDRAEFEANMLRPTAGEPVAS
uniref:Thiamine pyrophosphate enzyme TPP binding domain protein n=1 Tax=Solibacter usitatus (strain Ellin6076) TaxID=234267 RepID=Q025T6_SOLUE